MTRARLRQQVKAQAELHAEERVLDALVGPTASPDTRQKFRTRLRQGELDEKEVELEVKEPCGLQYPPKEIPGIHGAAMGLLNRGDICCTQQGGRTRESGLKVPPSFKETIAEERE